MANYNRALKKAPRDQQVLLLVPTGDTNDPLAVELGWWDAAQKRWEGDWRYDESEGNWAKANPIAWALIPEIDVGLAEPVKQPAKAARTRTPAKHEPAPPPF